MGSSEEEPLLSGVDSDGEKSRATGQAPVVVVSQKNGVRLYNVLALGIGFMCMFAAFQTSSMIEASVLKSIKKDTAGTAHPYLGDGYTSLAIIYIVFAFANWLAPSVVSVLGPRPSMIICGLIYTVFIASFLYPMTWALYVLSSVLGIGAAVLWTAQGKFLTNNSNSVTMARNSGIFWCILQCSLLIGNAFVYSQFRGITSIEQHTRYIVYGGLTGTCLLGVLVICTLRRAPSTAPQGLSGSVNEDAQSDKGEDNPGPVQAFVKAVKLFITEDMMLLSVAFLYTGLGLTYYSGVYGTSVGFTAKLGATRKDLIPITGILIGAGETTAGLLFGMLGKMTNKYGRHPIVFLGFVVQMVAIFLSFMNLPDLSPAGETDALAYMHPSEVCLLIGAYLLGFSDACYNTQIISLLGVVYSDNSSAAFALFKFMQSFSAAVGFFYSNSLMLKYQLLILVVMGTAGTISFCIVELKNRRRAE